MSALVVRPGSVEELRHRVVAAGRTGDTIAEVDLRALARVLDFSPDDMTVTVETGITMTALQDALAGTGQWLPLDPPHPHSTTLAEVLHGDISGPHRYAYGTVREHVIGIAAVLGDGRHIRSGGKVVKNVAGYDMARLLIGDHGALGIVVEVTFKLMPRPAVERVFALQSASLDDIDKALEAAVAGPAQPVVLDLHNLDGAAHGGTHSGLWTLVLAYAGHPDDVEWQAAQLGGEWLPLERIDHDARFWDARAFASTPRASVLPSRLTAHLRGLPSGVAVLARAGNGVAYGGLPDVPRAGRLPSAIERRLKAAYDPHDILPVLS